MVEINNSYLTSDKIEVKLLDMADMIAYCREDDIRKILA